MKLVKTLLVVFVVFLAVIVVGKNVIAKAAVASGAKMITGLDASIDSLQVGLFSTAVGVKGLKIKNPSKYPEKLMLDMPEIYIDYKLSDILKGKMHLEVIRLHMQTFNVVKAEDGSLNIQSIQALQQGKPAPSGKQDPKAPAGPTPKLQIDLLELQIGKVIYTDYTKNPPAKQEYDVNINERYEHITDPYTFAGLLVSRALFKTSIAKLANFDLQGLEAGVKQALSASTEQLLNEVTQGVGLAGQTSKQAVDIANQTGKEAVGAASDAVKDATGAMKKLFGDR